MTFLVTQKDMMEVGSSSALTSIMMMTVFPKLMTEYMYENPNVQKFIKSTGLHFDVIVAEEFFSDSLYMLAHKHKAPLVTICKLSINQIESDHTWIWTVTFDFDHSTTCVNLFRFSLNIVKKVQWVTLNTLIDNKDYWIHLVLCRIMWVFYAVDILGFHAVFWTVLWLVNKKSSFIFRPFHILIKCHLLNDGTIHSSQWSIGWFEI